MRMNEVMEISLEKQQTRRDMCRESVKTMSYSSTINLQLDSLRFLVDITLTLNTVRAHHYRVRLEYIEKSQESH